MDAEKHEVVRDAEEEQLQGYWRGRVLVIRKRNGVRDIGEEGC